MTFRSTIFFILAIFISLNCYSNELIDNEMSLGIKSYSESKYLDSIFYMNLVITKKNKLLTEAIFWKAKSLYEMGLYSDSKAGLELFFRKALIETSYYEDARFLYCKVFFKLKKYDDALLLFNQFIRNRTFLFYSDAALFWIGETYLQLSKLKLAKESFYLYLKTNPDSIVTKKRVDVIENMLSILDKNTNNEISLLDRANWLSEYVHKEQQNTSESDEMYISNFLNKFDTKQDFFKWLENYYLLDNEKKYDENGLKQDIIISNDEKEKDIVELDFIEKALLDELEYKIMNELGDGN